MSFMCELAAPLDFFVLLLILLLDAFLPTGLGSGIGVDAGKESVASFVFSEVTRSLLACRICLLMRFFFLAAAFFLVAGVVGVSAAMIGCLSMLVNCLMERHSAGSKSN